MNRLILSTTALFLAASQVHAAPFDMSPEADLRIVGQSVDEGTVAEPAAPPEPDAIRYLLPASTVRLDGEISHRDYQTYLTEAQAGARAVLQVSYLNALVVAPESSRLQVVINRDTVLSVPVASSAQSSTVEVEVPPGLLKAGFNTVTMIGDMRHRTDCSIGSTYELWSDLDGAETFLAFFGSDVGRLARLDDIAAIGVDSAGQTTIRMIMPNQEGTSGGELAAAAAQAIAVDMRVPNPVVEFADTLSDVPEPGVIQVVLSTADRLPEGLDNLATEAQGGTVAAFAAGHPAQNVLVLSGPTEASLAQAVASIEAVSAQYVASEGALPPTIDQGRVAPMITGGQTLRLEELGVDAVNFNGRRYSTQFQFDLPSDFYANNYGQARIDLNAAYASNVLPGSQVDIFVNGQIASSTPILRTDDDVRSLAITVPMKGFRPGRNMVQLVVGLRTQEDEICAPGTVTVGTDTRFLIAPDSTFSVPAFGRVAQLPNLAAFSGEAYPYMDTPPHLVVASGPDGLATGLTALTRVAAFTGDVIPLQSVSLASPSPSDPAIFVGGYNQLPPDVTQRMALLPPYADNAVAEQESNVESTLQRWRSQGNSASSSLLGRARGWIADLLDIRTTSFGLPMDDPAYAPRRSDQGFIMQRLQPEGGVWTLLTTPTPATADAGITALTAPASMIGYSGYITTLPASPAPLEVIEPADVAYFQPRDMSFENWRNIAANWLSGHVMAYALLFGVLAIILTFATSMMLRVVGRHSE